MQTAAESIGINLWPPRAYLYTRLPSAHTPPFHQFHLNADTHSITLPLLIIFKTCTRLSRGKPDLWNRRGDQDLCIRTSVMTGSSCPRARKHLPRPSRVWAWRSFSVDWFEFGDEETLSIWSLMKGPLPVRFQHAGQADARVNGNVARSAGIAVCFNAALVFVFWFVVSFGNNVWWRVRRTKFSLKLICIEMCFRCLYDPCFKIRVCVFQACLQLKVLHYGERFLLVILFAK